MAIEEEHRGEAAHSLCRREVADELNAEAVEDVKLHRAVRSAGNGPVGSGFKTFDVAITNRGSRVNAHLHREDRAIRAGRKADGQVHPHRVARIGVSHERFAPPLHPNNLAPRVRVLCSSVTSRGEGAEANGWWW